MFKRSKLLYTLIITATFIGVLFGVHVTAQAAENTIGIKIGEGIVSKYTIDTKSYKADGAVKMVYTYNGCEDERYEQKEETVYLADTGDDYTFSLNQAAPQMDEKTIIKFYNSSDEVMETITFSPYDYCDEIAGITDDDQLIAATETKRPNKLRTLCKSIVAYGKASQGVFADYIEKRGIEQITDDYSSVLGIDSATYTLGAKKAAGTNISFKTASFFCTSDSKMRFYLNVKDGFDLSTVEPTVEAPDGTEWSQNNADKYIEITGIKPVDYDERILITYPDGAKISMSVLDYAALLINSSAVSAADKALARTLIIYNQYAEEYFAAYKAPSFSYTGSWSGNDAKTQTIGDETYIMPDVSATSSTIGSTTVNGSTVYCPIVTVSASDSSGNAYSSGSIYYLAPAFSAINITDYNQDSNSTYTYQSSSTAWPRSNSSGPDDCFSFSGDSPYYDDTNNSYVASNGLYFLCGGYDSNRSEVTKTVKFTYTGTDGEEYNYYVRYIFSSTTYNSGDSGGGNFCITEDTIITLADGSTKRVDQLTGDEELLVWNLETGKYDSAPTMFIDSDPEGLYNVIHLYFSDGTETKLITEHAYFDLDEGCYVYIREDNYRDYIGDRFIKQGDIDNNTWNTVTLIDSEIIAETVTPYEPVTANHLCFYVDGMLSIPGGSTGFFNIFDVDTSNMTYDFEKMQKDIETYGLYTYEEFKDLAPEEIFYAANCAYLKVSVGKGLMTWDDILYVANRYANYIYDNQ